MKRGIDRGAPASNTASRRWHLRVGSERGSALLETGLILPIILFISVSIFEFGRLYQHIQVVTNAAREGARVSVLPSTSVDDVKVRVSEYLESGQLGDYATATVDVDQSASVSLGASTASASVVTVNYPFSFIVLNPVAKLVAPGSSLGGSAFTLTATAEMRNELQE